MKTFTTPKGTILEIKDIKGKDYLEVAKRLVWFREEKPSYGIETMLLEQNESFCLARAVIRDDKGTILSTAHKTETPQGFPDFIEKAETGAIGRALALIGYGTQFCADELEEGLRLADSPTSRSIKTKGNAPITKPRTANEIPMEDINSQLAQASSQPMQEYPPLDFDDFKGDAQETGAGDYVFNFGKHNGKSIRDFKLEELEGYAFWLENNAAKSGKPVSASAQNFIDALTSYRKQVMG